MGIFNSKPNKGRVDPKRASSGTSNGGQFVEDNRGAKNVPIALSDAQPISPVKKGQLIVLAGPGGVGKDTIIRELLKQRKELQFSVSTTTRAPRVGEVEGKDYNFVTKEAFDEIVNRDGFLEHATFGKSQYGTPKDSLLASLDEGVDVVTILELSGVEQVKKSYPESKIIFLVPPSIETLRERMSGRGDAEEKVEERIQIAKEELAKGPGLADHIVVSDETLRATLEISSLF